MTVLELQKKYLPLVAPEDFFVLLAHATQKEKTFLLAHPEYELPETTREKAADSLARRQKHEPVAYIVGEREFYGLSFTVTADTLIPRPETELLIECALKKILLLQHSFNNHASEKITCVDIGTGSGNIIVSIAQEVTRLFPNNQFTFFGLDSSVRALAVAQHNALRHKQEKNIIFLESNLLENFSIPKEKDTHLIIFANLPYLSTKIYQESDPDVRCFEPKSALESGIDGLDHYRQLLQTLPAYSQSFLSSTVFFEISPEQSVSLNTLVTKRFPQATLSLFQDLSGKDRLIQATF